MTAACLLLAACHRNEAENRPPESLSDRVIRFEIGIPPTRTETGSDFKTVWTAGDRIGIYATPGGETLQSADNPLHNVVLTYDGNAWSGNAIWPEGCSSLDFYAYYPYDEQADDPCAIAFAVKTDQRGATDGLSHYGLSDLMTATAGQVLEKETVTLQFSHALSMIQVSVPASPYKSMGPDETLTAYLTGVQTSATLNLGGSTPAVTLAAGSEPATVTMYRVPQEDAAGYTFRALIPAQTHRCGAGAVCL